MPEHEKNFLKSERLEGEPVLLLRGDSENWSVLTTREVVSRSAGTLISVSLSEMDHTTSIVRGDNGIVLKEEVSVLLAGPARIKVWSVPGAPLFALASILKMFPLAEFPNAP